MTEEEELGDLQVKETSLFFVFYENVAFMMSICGLVWGHSTKSVYGEGHKTPLRYIQ